MRRSDLAELVLLAALWGASFLFIRLGAADFGPVALAGLRVAGAAAVLVPILAARGQLAELRRHWRPLLVAGISNSAAPFFLFSFAALTLSAGLSSIFNAASPLFAALIGWLWLNRRLSPLRVLGLVIGFAGVVGLAYSKTGLPGVATLPGTLPAILACIAAAGCYGYSANFTQRYLSQVPPMAVATGTQVFATLALAVPTAWAWPPTPPSAGAWVGLALLAVVCTGLAYILYFRLIAHVGPGNAITVTFLIPAFAVGWGALFLHETPTAEMLVGCAVILLGTALATGVLRWPGPPR